MNYRNLQYGDPKHTDINCEVEHPELGWIPYTLLPDDNTEFANELRKTIEADNNVVIVDYTPETPFVNDAVKITETNLLFDPAMTALIKVLEQTIPNVRELFLQESHKVMFPPEWDSKTVYIKGDRVEHEGVHWIALPDVQTGMAPDMVYDSATMTGGWMLADLNSRQ
jgi:hypothetical protein